MNKIVCAIFVVAAWLTPCSAEMLKQPGLPFEISDARLDTNFVTKEVNLHFTLKNTTASELREITLGVVTWDSSGRPKAFQISPFKVNVPSGADEEVNLPMSNLLGAEPGLPPEFTAAVAEARGELDGWRTKMSPGEFAAALKAARPIPVEATPLSALRRSSDCPLFCGECRLDARCFCGKQVGCVKSYSCNQSTCTCSIECNTNGIGCTPPSNCI